LAETTHACKEGSKAKQSKAKQMKGKHLLLQNTFELFEGAHKNLLLCGTSSVHQQQVMTTSRMATLCCAPAL
jgi:hypothetical protein